MLIGLSGKAGSGKDTVGACLVEKHGFQRHAFADAVRHLAKSIGWDGMKDERGRATLITIGMAGREYAADFWVSVLWGMLEGRHGPRPTEWPNIVITDVRFPNEARWVRNNCGRLWRVDGRQAVVSAGVAASESETALDDYKFEATIVNNGDIAQLRGLVECALLGQQ